MQVPLSLEGCIFWLGLGFFFLILFFFKNKSNLALQAWKSPPLHTLSASPVSGWLLSWVPAGSALGGAGAGKCLVLHPSDLLYIPVLCFTSHSFTSHPILLLYIPSSCFTSHLLVPHPIPLLHIPFLSFKSHSFASHPSLYFTSYSFASHPISLLHISFLCFTCHFLASYPMPLLYIPCPCSTSHSLTSHPIPLLRIPFLYFHPIPLLHIPLQAGISVCPSHPGTEPKEIRVPPSLLHEVTAFQNGLMQIKVNSV